MNRLSVRLGNNTADILGDLDPQFIEGSHAIWHGSHKTLSMLLEKILQTHGQNVLEANISQPSLDEVFLQVADSKPQYGNKPVGGTK
jgi:hypothetical protein